MKKIITFDMDEVLTETIKSMLDYDPNIFGHPILFDEISNYDIHKIPKMKAKGIDLKSTVNKFSQFLDQKHSKIKPLKGIQEVILGIDLSKYDLFIVTAREDKLKNSTIQRTEKHFPGIFKDIFFTNHYNKKKVCKSNICEKLGSKLMIEDSPYNSTKVASKGTPVLLLNKPRNQNHKHNSLITKIQNPKEILNHLQKI